MFEPLGPDKDGFAMKYAIRAFIRVGLEPRLVGAIFSKANRNR